MSSYPIILAHGIYPFHFLFPRFLCRDNHPNDNLHYFRGIRSSLLRAGFVTFHSRVSWGARIEKRASELKDNIVRLTEGFNKWPRVHIIAHSMGGLDARWMIYRYKMHQRIVSLTTIGTPHHGSPEAALTLNRLGWIVAFCGKIGLDIGGAMDLTPKACSSRNRLLEPFEQTNGVIYKTVAGSQHREQIFLLARKSYDLIQQREGDNDGLVSVRSATWKREYLVDIIDADHLNQIGWWDGRRAMGTSKREVFEQRIKEFYLSLARNISAY